MNWFELWKISSSQIKIKNKIKVKGDGQECPSHTFLPTFFVHGAPRHVKFVV